MNSPDPTVSTAVKHPGKLDKSAAGSSTAIVSLPIFILSLIIGGLMVFIWQKRTQPDDWASLWIAGLLVDRGQQENLYDHAPVDFSAIVGSAWLGAAEEIPTPYPHPFVQNPLVAYAMSGLTRMMSFETSVLVLIFFSTLCFVYFIASCYYLWFHRTIPLPLVAAVTVLLIIAPAGHFSLWVGQTTPLIMAATAYGIAAAPRRPIWAGLLLGIAALVKITPLVVIVVMLFASRRRRAAVVAVISTAIFYALTFLVIDSEVILLWLERLNQINDAVLVSGANQSLASIIMAPHVQQQFFVDEISEITTAAKVVPVVSAAATTVLAIAVALFNRRYRFEFLVTSAWGIAVAFSAIFWTHYLVLLVLFVFGFAAMTGGKWMKSWPYFGIIMLIAMVNYPVSNPVSALPFTPGFTYAGTFALIGSLVFLLVCAAVHAASGAGRAPGEKMWFFDLIDRTPEVQEDVSTPGSAKGKHRAS